jgi:CPA2 family monovalent cation:H+ antiporter-2/glutathione-regulated potassium-efflux system protein KefB
VRAYDRRALIRLKGTPVRAIVREVMESAVKMARRALEDSGVSVDRSTAPKTCIAHATAKG